MANKLPVNILLPLLLIATAVTSYYYYTTAVSTAESETRAHNPNTGDIKQIQHKQQQHQHSAQESIADAEKLIQQLDIDTSQYQSKEAIKTDSHLQNKITNLQQRLEQLKANN